MPGPSALLRNTLLTLSYRHRVEELTKDYPGVIVLLTYGTVGMEEGFQAIQQMKEENVRLQLWVDDHLTKYFSLEEVVQRTGVNDFKLERHDPRQPEPTFPILFLPVLSYSLVSKIMQMDGQDWFTSVIMESIFAGGRVGGISAGADPFHPLWKEKGWDQAPITLKLEMKTRLRQIRSYGIDLLEVNESVQWTQNITKQTRKKRVISEATIQQALVKGLKTIQVDRGSSLMTPLARDLAKLHGLQILE